MNPELELIREQQKETWNRFSAGWQEWDDFVMHFLQPARDGILRLMHPAGKDQVLDIASGTGEPALSIAERISEGKVILTDLSEGMLHTARQKAAARGIKNIDTHICDVSELPFADNSFDAVSCRFGFMFFPDMKMAAKEILRVLKPGGRFVTTVWNIPEKNFWVTVTMGTVIRNLALPPNPSGAPGMFRCSRPGMMTELLEGTGFTNASQEEISGMLKAGTAENYWNFTMAVSAPVVMALNNTDEAMKTKIKNEVFEQLAQKYGQGPVEIESGAWIVYGEKQSA